MRGFYYSENKSKYGGWYHVLKSCQEQTIGIFAKFIIELVALAVKSNQISDDRDIFMSMLSADGLGFPAVL